MNANRNPSTSSRSRRNGRLTENACCRSRAQLRLPGFPPSAKGRAAPLDPDSANDERGERSSETTSVLTLYLREIGQVKLLDREQELDLIHRLKQGDEAARELMIKANLRLVVRIARQFEGLGLPLLDLISEGNLGLMKAVERYDPNRGAKFSVYAALWIKQTIRRSLANDGRSVRLPVHVHAKLLAIGRVVLKLHDLLEREPTDEEIAIETRMTPKRVRQLRQAGQFVVSLDEPIENRESTSLADIIADERARTPYETLDGANRAALLDLFAGHLDARERLILRARYGLDGEDEKTLEELSQQFGLTRERIRQIQNQALGKLRCQFEKLEPTRTCPPRRRSADRDCALAAA